METIRRATALTVLLLLVASVASPQRLRRQQADTREDVESPTPVLLVPGRGGFARGGYRLGDKIELFISDLALLPGEGANSIRVYAKDKRGNRYRFPSLALRQVDRNVWGLTTLLADEIGYYAPPEARGDLLIYVTWRGLASNPVSLTLGRAVRGPREDTTIERPALPLTRTAVSAPLALPVGREADRLRFQEQAAFGPTPALSAQLSRTKLANWIQSQFDAPYPTFPYPSQPLKPTNALTDCDGQNGDDVPLTCFRDTYTMYPIQTWNSQEMLYGSNQLRHKTAWALSQIWVNSGVDIQQSRWMVEWHKILSNNAFGNYRTLMRQMTLSPTMGEYLSMNQSTRTNPNENYAREIMQLFTIGLFMLNPDGTVQCVEHNPCLPGDTEIPSYDQNTVNDLTKVLTGWSLCNNTALCPNAAPGTPNYIDPMLLNFGSTNVNNNRHDLTAKTLLQYPNAVSPTIPACTTTPPGNCTATGGTTSAQAMANISAYAYASLDQSLDNIFYHPNLGPYVSKVLIQQFVTSDPTPAYVGRVAAAFNNNGSGVRGDMKAVIMAILLDPEARGNTKTDPNYGKLREPVQLATNLLRAYDARGAAGTGQSDGVLTNVGSYTGMGQIPFRSPTVFNYYPPNFVVPGTAMLGPEFALLTTGTTIQRANFVNQMVFNSPAVPVTANSNNGGNPAGTSLTFTDLQAISSADPSGNALIDELNRRMMHGTMSAAMKTTILNALTPTAATDIARVRQAVYLVATSSQYQVQR